MSDPRLVRYRKALQNVRELVSSFPHHDLLYEIMMDHNVLLFDISRIVGEKLLARTRRLAARSSVAGECSCEHEQWCYTNCYYDLRHYEHW